MSDAIQAAAPAIAIIKVTDNYAKDLKVAIAHYLFTPGAKPKKVDLYSAIEKHNAEVSEQVLEAPVDAVESPVADEVVEQVESTPIESTEPVAPVDAKSEPEAVAAPVSSLQITDEEKQLNDEMAGFLSVKFEQYYGDGAKESEAEVEVEISGEEVEISGESENQSEGEVKEMPKQMSAKEKGKAKAKTTVSKTKTAAPKAPKDTKGVEDAIKLYDECKGNVKAAKEKTGKSDPYIRRMFKAVEVYRANAKIKKLIDDGKITFWKLHAAVGYKEGVAELEKLG